MDSQLGHKKREIPTSMLRWLAKGIAVGLLSLSFSATGSIEKSIQRAAERAAQKETERSIEDAVRLAFRAQMRRAIEKNVEFVVAQEAEQLIEKVAAKQIGSTLQQELLNTASSAYEAELAREMEIAREAGQSRVRAIRQAQIEKETPTDIKKGGIVAKPSDDVSKPVDNDLPEPASIELPLSERTPNTRLLSSQIERIEADLGISENLSADLYGRDVWTREWVIMTDRETREKLRLQGYLFSNESYLETFDQIVASVQAPASFNLKKDYETIMAQAEDGQLLVDYNHIYRNAEAGSVPDTGSAAKAPAQLVPSSDKKMVIGMVDTAYDKQHPVLQHAQMQQSHFLPENAKPTATHGTGVASIMVGRNESYQGIAPNAKLLNASVFFEVGKKQPIATATDILKGLNWLVQNGATVINMSLAGPENRLLEFGINSLCKKGIYVVAAAGNAGPLSEPLYPAGYDCAVAVTAVDVNRQIYRYAVQGNHIDVSAYGVDVLAASDKETIAAASGTSIAAPFITVVIADSLMASKEPFNLQNLFLNSIDLGVSGFDPQFGHGLLMLAPPAIDVAANSAYEH